MSEWTPEQIRRSYRPCSECGDPDHAGVLCPGFTVPALDRVDAAQYSAGQWAAGLERLREASDRIDAARYVFGMTEEFTARSDFHPQPGDVMCVVPDQDDPGLLAVVWMEPGAAAVGEARYGFGDAMERWADDGGDVW